jgi:hypothetical protein
MESSPQGTLVWRVDELFRWKKRIDDLKPDVMAFELGELRKDVNALRRALYTFALSVVLAALVFAFSVFALIGHHG